MCIIKVFLSSIIDTFIVPYCPGIMLRRSSADIASATHVPIVMAGMGYFVVFHKLPIKNNGPRDEKVIPEAYKDSVYNTPLD